MSNLFTQEELQKILPSKGSHLRNLALLSDLLGFKMQSVIKGSRELVLTLGCGAEAICITAYSFADAYAQIESLI